jgi:hypothetical protein
MIKEFRLTTGLTGAVPVLIFRALSKFTPARPGLFVE